MIIDTHMHLGSQGLFDLPYSVLLRQMDAHGIAKGLVSSVECSEFQPYTAKPFPNPSTQLETNRQLLEKVQRSNGRLYLTFWCKCATECADGVYDFVRSNAPWVRGLKFHPFYSRLALDDPRYIPYLEIAQQLDLPVCVHTDPNHLSTPEQLLTLAKRFPQVRFVMVHMNLGTDHEDAIRCLTKADNLYGDTTWVSEEAVIRAMRICGSTKILFGSDAPIDGDESYRSYAPLLRLYRENPNGAWADVMYKNAQSLFGI